MTGFMAREFFGTSPLLVLPILALVLFVAAFTGLALRAWRMDRRAIDHRARLALDSAEGGRADG